MKIYDASNNLLLDVAVDDNSYRYRAIMGDHNLTLYFALAEHVELPVGAWCEFQAQKYYLMRPQSLTMHHTRYFEYTVVMESAEWRASTWTFRCIYTDEKKSELSDGRIEFPMTATAGEFLQMVVDNLNFRDSGWSVGEYVDDGAKALSFSHNSILDALQMIADEFKTEYEITAEKVVSLHKLSYYKSTPLALSYGKGNGIKPDIKRSNTNDTMPVERLWIQGGEQNIDKSKYGSKTLHLPKGGRLSYDGEHFEGEYGYGFTNARTYVADANGLSISRADKTMSTYAESSLDLTDIYPKRVGTVSQVVAHNEEKHIYYVYDTSIPDSLDYNDCKIADEQMTLIFQTGMLAGREFEIAKYNHGNTQDRYFQLIPAEIDGYTMPGGVYVPAEGDTYAVFGCSLPASYVGDEATKSGAEWEMMRQAVKYMYENEDEKFTISASLDGIWAKKDWVNIGGRIRLGSYIKFTDERFFPDGVLVRIAGIKDYINKPHSPEIELSNDVTSPGFSSTIKQMESTPALIEDVRKESKQYTKRRFHDAKDTMAALQELVESGLSKFTDGISPISVQTMQLLVGDESLQFRFVSSATSPTKVDDSMYYDSSAKQLIAPSSSIIQHLTLDITDISNKHSANEYKYWYVNPYTSAVLDVATKRYYIYIRAGKNSGYADFYLSESALEMEISTYYYFLFGILNSEYDGTRSIARLYGYTEILPGRITTDKIVSDDGLTYFDLANSIIGGKIKFRTTDGSEKYVSSLESDIAAAQQDATEANNKLTNWAKDDYISPTEKKALSDMRSQIVQDYEEVLSRCQHYNVNTTDFTAAYTAAVTAIGKYTNAEPENIQIDTDYANIAAYWEAKKVVLLSINTAVYGEYTDLRGDIDDAASDAALALAQAQSAQNNLNNWADDKKVSPAEKASLKQMKAQIVKDYEEIQDRCGKYDIAYDNFTTAYNAAITALDKYTADTPEIIDIDPDYDNIAAYWTARTTILKTINASLNSYADKIVEEATTNLEKAIADGDADTYNKSVKEIEAFGETIIQGGHIITDLIDTDTLQVRKVISGEADENGLIKGRRVEITPQRKSVDIFDENGDRVQTLEGSTYTSLSNLFSNSSGSFTIQTRTKTEYGYDSGVTLGKGECYPDSYPEIGGKATKDVDIPISSVVYSNGPARITFGAGKAMAYASTGSRVVGETISQVAAAKIQLMVMTYSDSACTKQIDKNYVGPQGEAYAYGFNTNSSNPVNWAGYSIAVSAGYHKVYLRVSLEMYGLNSKAYVTWGKSVTIANINLNGIVYTSRFFANGFCLGTRIDNYIFAYQQSETAGMRFVMENSGYGIDVSNNGIKVKHHDGSWRSMPLFVAKFRVAVTSDGATVSTYYTWDGVDLTAESNVTRSARGTIKITYPTGWKVLSLSNNNLIINAVGYKSGTEYSKPTLYDINSTSCILYLSDDNTLNDNMAADITMFKIS